MKKTILLSIMALTLFSCKKSAKQTRSTVYHCTVYQRGSLMGGGFDTNALSTNTFEYWWGTKLQLEQYLVNGLDTVNHHFWAECN
jgi:hypothetical protein